MDHVVRQKLQSNIWKFYLCDILGGLVFPLPIIVLFWQQNGLSFTQMMLLQSYFSIVVLLLDIPTGYLADLFSRKKTLLFAGIFTLIGAVTYSLGHTFIAFLVAESFWGIGTSLYSGTGAAFIYDSLKGLNRSREYSKIWGDAKFYGFLALAFSGIVGGFLGKLNFRYTFYLMIPSLLGLVFITLTFQEPKIRKISLKQNHFKELVRTIQKAILQNKALLSIILFSAIVVAFLKAAGWFYQPYYQLINIDVVYFGLLFAAFQIAAALGSKYSHIIMDKIGETKSLILLFIVSTASILLMGKYVVLFGLIFILMQQILLGFSEPVISTEINKMTQSKTRATVLSAQSMVRRVIYALIIPFLGYIVDAYSLSQSILVAGVSLLTIGTISLIILKRNKVI